ncbi:ATP synthase mitochondrial F1 complex assembly factor 2, partial [Coemansia spiralis]
MIPQTRWAAAARHIRRMNAPRRGLSSSGDPAPAPTPAIRRFWRAVSVGERDGHHVVLLDKRPIKTPDGCLVRIAQQQRALAWLVAAEWEAQKEVLSTHSLPLTSLVSRAIDGLSDPAARGDVIDKLLKYFQTDSVCLHEEFPHVLVELQQQHYTPILAWARSTYGVDIQTTTDLFALRQSPQAVAVLRGAVAAFSPLKLAALERATMSAKSLLI